MRSDHNALTWLQNFNSPEGQLAKWLEMLQEYKFTIVHRPGWNTLMINCQQCERNTEDIIASMSLATISGRYISEKMRCMQLDEKCLGELKESCQKPSQDYSKSHNPGYWRLYQQWDQLMVHSRVLWQYCL